MAGGARAASSVDWPSLQRQIETARRGIKAALAPPRGRAERILEERARTLAAARQATDEAAVKIDVLPLVLRSAPYLLESLYVREVLRAPQVAPVPRAPAFLAGLTNRQGELLAVVDLAVFLGIAAVGDTRARVLVVLGRDSPEFAILADSIDPVTLIAADAVHGNVGVGEKHIRGITDDGRPLLDAAALFTDPALFLKSPAQERT